MPKVLIGNITDIDTKGARTVFVQDKEIAVFRLTNGGVKAVENRCPHKGGKLSEGMVCGEVVHCPLHDWRIDLKSGRAQAPDDGCIEAYETEVDPANGSIYILL